jgi:hypothetical protein
MMFSLRSDVLAAAPAGEEGTGMEPLAWALGENGIFAKNGENGRNVPTG